jgi:chemosensory pili system protein ChpC
MTTAIPCLLLPLHQKNILLPSMAVAEIIDYEEPKQIEDVPEWLLGLLTWRGVPIPLAHLEKMDSPLAWNTSIEGMDAKKSRKYYIAVINRSKKIVSDYQEKHANPYPFFAVLVEGVPKLCHVYESAIKIVTQFPREDKRFLMEVKIQNDCAVIPHLESLWAMIDALPARLQWFRQIVL